MTDTDRDIEALDSLLGGAKAEYQAMRHPGKLRRDFKPAPRRIQPRTYAIAASILLFAAGLSFIDGSFWFPKTQTMTARIALAKPTMPLSLRPDYKAPKRLSVSRPKTTKGRLTLQLPRRPFGSKS